jgi:hypothetical protein
MYIDHLEQKLEEATNRLSERPPYVIAYEKALENFPNLPETKLHRDYSRVLKVAGSKKGTL